jgi:hypothetical protein
MSQFHCGSITIDFPIASIIYFSGYVKLWFLSLMMVTPRRGSVWQCVNFCHSSTVRLCRNYVKELTLNPSLGKRGTFLPLLFIREGGRVDELCNSSIATHYPERRMTKEKVLVTPRLSSVWQWVNFRYSSTVKLCRNFVKELTLNPSLRKRETFFTSLRKRKGMSYSIFILRHSLPVEVWPLPSEKTMLEKTR